MRLSVFLVHACYWKRNDELAQQVIKCVLKPCFTISPKPLVTVLAKLRLWSHTSEWSPEWELLEIRSVFRVYTDRVNRELILVMDRLNNLRKISRLNILRD